MMVRVMAVGIFDLLHAGHLHYVEQAKSLGDELVVVIAHDETVRKQKFRLNFLAESPPPICCQFIILLKS